nr:ribonuclease H-like domain, reverse transcriptase, RNA-dependent DNA polymerase [Tanacetum cinerariifolium]
MIELKTLKQEKDVVEGKLTRLLKSLKDLESLIESQRSDKVKEGVGYNVVPPHAADLYLSPKKDLSWTGLPEFVDDIVTDYSRPSPTVASTSAEGPEFVLNKKACFICGDSSYLANDCRKRVQRDTTRPAGHRPHGPSMNPMRPNMNGARPNRSFFIQAHSYETRPFLKSSAMKTQYRAPWVPTVNRNNPLVNRKFSTGRRNFPTSIRNFPLLAENLPLGSTQNNIDDKGYWDSGCSRHMTGNISYLFDFEPFDGGYVSFGQGGCKIT